MGRIGAPFGVRGWVKVHTFTARDANLLDYPVWWLGRDERWHEVRIEESEAHSKGIVVRLAGCEDREHAAALSGMEIAVPRDALPPPGQDEFYWADLIGLGVVNLQGREFGQVEQMLQTGANDVLVVRGERERLIPFIADAIKKVDLAARVITVDWGEDW